MPGQLAILVAIAGQQLMPDLPVRATDVQLPFRNLPNIWVALSGNLYLDMLALTLLVSCARLARFLANAVAQMASDH